MCSHRRRCRTVPTVSCSIWIPARVEANAKPPSQNDRYMRSATWDRNSIAIPRRMRGPRAPGRVPDRTQRDLSRAPWETRGKERRRPRGATPRCRPRMGRSRPAPAGTRRRSWRRRDGARCNCAHQKRRYSVIAPRSALRCQLTRTTFLGSLTPDHLFDMPTARPCRVVPDC
jgi:hypothetical protein